LIFSQIDQNKIQSQSQLVTSFLPFHCFASIKPIFSYYKSTTMFYSYNSAKLPCHVFSAVSHYTHIAGTRGPMRSFAMSIYSGGVVSKDVLKSFRNLLQGGDGTSAKKFDEDLDILWVSKCGNVDLSKWSKDDFSTGFIANISIANILPASPWQPISLACVLLQRKSFTNTFWQPHFSIW